MNIESIGKKFRATAYGFAGAALVAAGIAACGGGSGPPVTDIKVLSSRPDLVSGGDALVEVQLTADMTTASMRVTLNGADVAPAFSKRADGRYIGLVSGLRDGENRLSAWQDGWAVKSLTLTNHPKGGPLISGPQLQPWVCETAKSGLGAPVDAQCNAAAPVVDYLYKSTDTSKTSLLAYNPKAPAGDVATTVTDAGKSVPFIVRRETGTLNRGVYSIAVLADPNTTPSLASPPAAWNGNLYYVFVGGALPQYRQGPVPGSEPTTAVLAVTQLGKGYVTAASTLTTFGQNVNSVVSAETVLMIKEKIIKSFGEIGTTLSTGGSGGSIQQNQLANAYPGLLDGINPSATFTDFWSTHTEVQDCSLLVRYFDTVSPSMWSSTVQQNAVMDNADAVPGTCRAWTTLYHLDEGLGNPASTSCQHEAGVLVAARVKQPWMWDAASNTGGARCTAQDYLRNILGTRPDGYANRPYDNVGVQYGLKALKAGTITVDQFLDLNEKVGGRDINWGPTAQRSAADSAALAAMYRSGQLNLGTNAGGTPIVDDKACVNTEIHSCFHSYKLRERLKATNGSAANHVLLLDKPAADQTAFDTLVAWVRAIKADKDTAASDAAKVARNRPASAVDACWIGGVKTTDAAACATAKPYFGDPRMGAGAPITETAVKCQLAPLDRASYVTMTDPQWARLGAIFPTGVCDWSKPGVGETAAVPWLSYAAGPNGAPLGQAPAAKAD